MLRHAVILLVPDSNLPPNVAVAVNLPCSDSSLVRSSDQIPKLNLSLIRSQTYGSGVLLKVARPYTAYIKASQLSGNHLYFWSRRTKQKQLYNSFVAAVACTPNAKRSQSSSRKIANCCNLTTNNFEYSSSVINSLPRTSRLAILSNYVIAQSGAIRRPTAKIKSCTASYPVTSGISSAFPRTYASYHYRYQVSGFILPCRAKFKAYK